MSLTITVAQGGSRLHFQQLIDGVFIARYYPSGSGAIRASKLVAGRPFRSWRVAGLDVVLKAVELFPNRDVCMDYLSAHSHHPEPFPNV